MNITIPKGISIIYYSGSLEIALDTYKSYINQVLEIHDDGLWFKLYNPALPEFSDLSSLTPSLSYEFTAYSDFIITV